jgi:hypothetical protein
MQVHENGVEGGRVDSPDVQGLLPVVGEHDGVTVALKQTLGNFLVHRIVLHKRQRRAKEPR